MIPAPRPDALYPPIVPFDNGRLQVDDIHNIYYEQSGSENGVPVVFLHGGPGAGASPRHRQFFDPAHYRIIVFDQRGAGNSTPKGELRNNTTELLVEDIEKLREMFGFEKWHVFGGSWGSTLALAYAIAHPERVMSLTLRGIFMMTAREIQWFLYGIRAVFPEAWESLAAGLKENEREDILGNYYKLLTHNDPQIRLQAAERWSAFETACCQLIPNLKMIEDSKDPVHALPVARIEAHYFLHNRFKPDNYLLENIDKIRHIPAVIIQGRYDAVCPIETAWDLHHAWPEAEFVIVPEAGHSAFEHGISVELVKAMNRFRAIR